ncbi:MAG: HAD family hydrolase [Halothiobacillaceae bacterium]|jgi:3-deoxy-D-manno-octulosonate 8-phosphate phosphatase (KDO 8-P phosphatase)|nr:HAD family hydrolase [Halothiobacillaceae bacterium]
MQDILERASRIKLVIFDVDGVLTDGRLYFDDEGREYKAFHSRDGHGMKLLQQAGVPIAIITGRSSDIVRHRMAGLGITHVYQGREDKLGAYLELCDSLSIAPEETACMGDDVLDLPMLTRAGLAATVNDAPAFIKRHAHWVAASKGGQGAARELCELILEARGALDAVMARYLA